MNASGISKLQDPAIRAFTVTSLLSIQFILIAHSAALHSPTYLEPAFLASGIANWTLGRFEPYDVNPPLVRMLAALPVFTTTYKVNWQNFHEGLPSRSEFALGEMIVKENQTDVLRLVYYARLACIPFSTIGAYFAYKWACELYGLNAGLVALVLYVFEPNLLAHGELITSDSACTGLGILAGYSFWRWLKRPTFNRAALAGGALGIAELSKLSWLMLFALWPAVFVLWQFLTPRIMRPLSQDANEFSGTTSRSGSQICRAPSNKTCKTIEVSTAAKCVQLAILLLVAVYVINLGYGFDGSGTTLREFQFVSKTFTGHERPDVRGNRFRDLAIGSIPVPLPRHFLLGLDSQKADFERHGEKSFLRGEWREEGWWYYYAYGLLVKVPCGIWVIFAIVVFSRRRSKTLLCSRSDELVLLTPAVALLILVSSQTAFNIHLRYVFPSLGLLLIFIGQIGMYLGRDRPLRSAIIAASLAYTVSSSMLSYPNHLAYFNDFVGGSANGHNHLLGSSLDWGQGTSEAIRWIQENEPDSPLELRVWDDVMAVTLRNGGEYGAKRSSTDDVGIWTLKLYSADYYSQKVTQKIANQKDGSDETVVKRFAFGSVLVRVRTGFH